MESFVPFFNTCNLLTLSNEGLKIAEAMLCLCVSSCVAGVVSAHPFNPSPCPTSLLCLSD